MTSLRSNCSFMQPIVVILKCFESINMNLHQILSGLGIYKLDGYFVIPVSILVKNSKSFLNSCILVHNAQNMFWFWVTVKSHFEPAGSIKIATFLVRVVFKRTRERVQLIYFFNAHRKGIMNQDNFPNLSKISIKMWFGKI